MQSSIVNKKPARSNDNVEYCEPITLDSTSESEISFLPFFIKHSDPTAERDLAIKITKSKRKGILLSQQAEINLNKKAVLQLREA